MASDAAAGKPIGRRVFLGIEAGGTRTVAATMGDAIASRRLETGPANLRLVNDGELTRHFAEVGQKMPRPSAIAIGMEAGAACGDDFVLAPAEIGRDSTLGCVLIPFIVTDQ